MYKLGVVIGPKNFRNSLEIAQYVNLRHFDITFFGSNNHKPRIAKDVDYVYVGMKKILPDFLANFFVRKPYSPVSFIKLEGVDDCLSDVDLVNCVELYSFISSQCSDIKKRRWKKLVVVSYETIPENPLLHFPPYSLNVKKVLERADLFLAITNKAAGCLYYLGIPKEKVKVIYPGIDIDAFSHLEQDAHEVFRILFVGRFDREKGLHTLLQAFLRLYADKRNVELWICGPPRTGKEAEILARRLAKKYPVRMFGYVEHGKLPEVYGQCDVLCLPSFDREKWGMKVWEEQYGFVLVEAMACGLPIVATDCGAVPEIMGPYNITVPQKSVDALYLALCKLFKNVDYRQHVAKVNRKRAEEVFDIEKQRAKLDEVLCELFMS